MCKKIRSASTATIQIIANIGAPISAFLPFLFHRQNPSHFLLPRHSHQSVFVIVRRTARAEMGQGKVDAHDNQDLRHYFVTWFSISEMWKSIKLLAWTRLAVDRKDVLYSYRS